MTKLYEHQQKILSDLKNGRRYVVAAPRTGKTRPVIEFLRDCENVLVLTKKAAIPGWLSELDAMGVSGWTVLNYEKVRTKGWDMLKQWGALVCDEAHTLATYPKPNTMTKPIYQLAVSGPRIGISATPSPETYSQLFHQAKALKLPIWAEFSTFYKWHKVYGVPDLIRANGRMLETYKNVPQRAWDEFKVFCCILDRKRAVADFVEAEDQLIRIEAPAVLELCEKLKRDMIIEIGGRVVVAETPLALAQKCQQICSGVVLDENGEPVRVNLVKHKFITNKFAGQKTAILTQYRAEVDMYGGTEDQEAFRSGGAKWFVGNVQKYARGVDLAVADALVFTGCPWSAEAFIQGRERLLRRDRESKAPVYFPVIAGGIDEQIYHRVAVEKRDFNARIFK